METPSRPAPASARTTPKDFFLWLLAVITLYGSVSSFLALLFHYINYSFPDALAGYADPYGGAARFSMAALIVLIPTLLITLRLIRGAIAAEPAKVGIWVRRWALGLTLFIATATIIIDLVTLINTFLGGEITIRFALKVGVVLLVAVGVFLHFLADMKGYWIEHAKKANYVGIGVAALVIVTIIAGFFIIGTPSHVRDLKLDAERVGALQSIQSQVTYYFQQKQTLPESLAALSDPLSGFTVPTDPVTNAPYEYEKTGTYSFSLCTTFAAAAPDTKNRGSARDVVYPSYLGIEGDSWQHDAGHTCFSRTIDPDKYPPLERGKPLPL